VRQSGAVIAASIDQAVEELAGRAGRQPVDAVAEMTRLVHRVINPVFFGSRISVEQCDRLGAEVATALGALLWRMAMPFVPHRVPMPGGRAFLLATRSINRTLLPVIDAARREDMSGTDLMSGLLRGRGTDGRHDRRRRAASAATAAVTSRPLASGPPRRRAPGRPGGRGR
jgi:cytochrome P450